MDNTPTTGSVYTTNEVKKNLARSSLAYNARRSGIFSFYSLCVKCALLRFDLLLQVGFDEAASERLISSFLLAVLCSEKCSQNMWRSIKRGSEPPNWKQRDY